MILFIADIHIKIGAKNVSKDWAKNRVVLLVEELTKIIKVTRRIDTIIVGGDLLDRAKPTMEELELMLYFLSSFPSIPRKIIFSGNHEMLTKKVSVLSKLKVLFDNLGWVLVDKNTIYKDEFNVLPYQTIKTTSMDIFDHTLPVFTHVRGSIPPHVKAEVDLNIFSIFPIVYAGDLHHHHVQKNIVYPGSPYTTSFSSEIPKNKGVLLIDGINWEFIRLDLPAHLKLNYKDKAKDTYNNVIYEVEGTLTELSSIKDSNVIKKTKTNKDITLDLTNLSLEEEVYIYISEILKEEATGAIDELKNFIK